jgi:L-lysine exporter family protein LysE/ArgO
MCIWTPWCCLARLAASSHRMRALFAAGATLAPVPWFFSLGYGARLLAPVFARPIRLSLFL